MPITPEQARKKKGTTIPQQVYDAFDELIVEQLTTAGRARVNQSDVVDRILRKLEEAGISFTSQDIFSKKWLDVEEFYKDAGWEVLYDKPSYYESSAAYFVFSSPTKSTSGRD